ncbi:MAG TPA: hypothetical protein VF516_34885 [Kofleriaceae bacterium]
MSRPQGGFSLALAVVAGCSTTTSYLYAPQAPSYWSDGYPATTVAVPPEAPQGKVEVASFGITEIKPDGDGPVAALHVRLAVSNDGDATPWTLTPSEQLVEIAGEGRSRPIFVNTDLPTLPAVSIAQHERRVLDLYYPLPTGMREEAALPAFDVLWQLTTPARSFSSRTRFQRVEQVPPPGHTEVVFWTGWGPYWWYDPFYPDLVFLHHPPMRLHSRPHVIVTRPPRWHSHAVHDHRRS